MSANLGTREAANFLRAARSGRNASSIRTPSVPACSTTLKLEDAPGSKAAMPIGVMLGSAQTAGRTLTSADFGSRSASSTPISNRMASTKKYATGFGCTETTSL
jgi:hypothetical protein